MQDIVRTALHGFPGPWQLLDHVRLPRLLVTIDLVLVTTRAVLVFATDRAAADAAAVALADFHAGCRNLPVIPVVLLAGERVVAQRPLSFPGAARPVACTRLLLPGLLAEIARFPVVPGADPESWADSPYRPVPALMQAAAALYARHDAAELMLTSSGHGTLEATRAAIAEATAHARTADAKHIIFVTGPPGSGKTLCGLDAAFAPGAEAAFLTGNPALLHVLRAALVRDAASRGLVTRAARGRVHAVIQPLHAFRDGYAAAGTPPDRILVIDEAQRCWTATYAARKSRNKPVQLHGSEPTLILDIMARHGGFSLVLCLLGGGQEIHAGEGGLAAWGEALAADERWYATAPPGVLTATDPRQRLPPSPRLRTDARLHLADPVRALTASHWTAWVDAVLANDPATARTLAQGGLPLRITRSLTATRRALHRPNRRVGLVASAGGRRLRAEGLGGLLWHQDDDAVARWFLDPWPDIRSSDALEIAATEFGIQGLELDAVGLCWDLDLLRDPRHGTWTAQAFRATAWTRTHTAEALSNKRNAYRVLLTRARRETIIWIPRGDRRDPTRTPESYDAIAGFLLECGAPTLDDPDPALHDAPVPEPALL